MAGSPTKKPEGKTGSSERLTKKSMQTSPSLPSSSSEKLELDDVAVTLAVSNSAIRALSHFGSRKVVDSILDLLELDYSVSINDAARRPEVFSNAIASMFGPGADLVMKILCTEIARDLGVSREGKSLAELVRLAGEKRAGADSPSDAVNKEVITQKQ